MSPQRIQLRRTKGWRKPDGAVVVSRPSRWGNPFKVGGPRPPIVHRYGPGAIETVDEAVAHFRFYTTYHFVPVEPTARRRGCRSRGRVESLAQHARKHLACWCPLDSPCHANVLLEIANSAPVGEKTDGEKCG